MPLGQQAQALHPAEQVVLAVLEGVPRSYLTFKWAFYGNNEAWKQHSGSHPFVDYSGAPTALREVLTPTRQTVDTFSLHTGAVNARQRLVCALLAPYSFGVPNYECDICCPTSCRFNR